MGVAYKCGTETEEGPSLGGCERKPRLGTPQALRALWAAVALGWRAADCFTMGPYRPGSVFCLETELTWRGGERGRDCQARSSWKKTAGRVESHCRGGVGCGGVCVWAHVGACVCAWARAPPCSGWPVHSEAYAMCPACCWSLAGRADGPACQHITCRGWSGGAKRHVDLL